VDAATPPVKKLPSVGLTSELRSLLANVILQRFGQHQARELSDDNFAAG
jgi:hypothetical protein